MAGLLSMRRVARSIVAALIVPLIPLSIGAPTAQAAVLGAPTISSITSGASSLTVNMVTAGYQATSWRWMVKSISGVGCIDLVAANTPQATASLSSSFTINQLTDGCVYSVKVAGYNGVTSPYTDMQKLVGVNSNGLNVYTKNETGYSADSTHTPFMAGTCNTSVVANISIDYGTGGPGNCNTDGFTSYYVGYIKAPYTGSVTFRASSDDGFYLNIQGQNVISLLTENGPTLYNATGSINMVANEIYRIEVWHHEYTIGSGAWLYWDWSGQTTQIVPSTNLATDPSVFFGTCPIGVAARCAAGSAQEIKQATGTNMDGMYWIDVNGTPTLTYCIMNSDMKGGGWMLAMKGKKASSTFGYSSSYWTNATTLNENYPQRWKNGDTVANNTRDVDAKYGVFGYSKANQIMALFPEQTTYAGGAVAAGTTGNTSVAYGFSWIETTTAGRVWTSADGNSYATNLSANGGPNGSSCVTTATTLTNLFTNSNRCAFRKVSASYSASESPYSAIGEGLFYSQTYIRFFGINYGSSNSSNMALARWGFGWNENDATNEGSNDGTGGIGLSFMTYSNITAGTINNCCESQAGLSGAADRTSTNIPFEMYIRNSLTASVSLSNLRVTSGNSDSMVDGSAPTVTGTNGSNTFRLSPQREGFTIDPTTGVVTVSQSVPVGTYSQTVSVIDTDGVSGVKTISIEVVGESGEIDRALSFDGSSQYLATTGQISIPGAQTWEFWVKPTSSCSGATNQLAFGSNSVNIFCKSYYWYVSFRNTAGTWGEVKLSQRVVSDEWAHMAVVFDGSVVKVYYNKAQLLNYGTNALSWSLAGVYSTPSVVFIGGTGSAGYYFSGVIDEAKIWTSARTQAQVVAGAHSRENLGNGSLLHYWDFNEGSGSAISHAQNSDSSFNLTPASGQWTSIAQTATYGPYTVVTFPRTIINAFGGWKTPDSITAVTALIVGGGGGGGWNTGGGGGGGAIIPVNKIAVEGYESVIVGTGGEGALSTTTNSIPIISGETGSASSFDAYTASGGNKGADFVTNQNSLGGTGLTNSTGSFTTTSGTGGTGPSTSNSNGTAGTNGYSSSITGSTLVYGSGGGGGAYGGNGGAGGTGAGNGGGASAYPTGTVASSGFDGTPNRGGGGGGSAAHVAAGNGGSGVVIIRYITALKPSFTPPTNAYLNEKMTETFTTNVAADSSTVILTRTFRWESSTTGAAGTFTKIKEGTGASNAYFSWVPQDTATSGSNFVYRVIVTDSDTAGLFIQDTSTAVYANINPALVQTSSSGNSTILKTINISRSETFTVSLGTPTYTFSLSPIISGISIDTSTAGKAILRISDTQALGTYYETLTVIDSVTGTLVTPLTIIVSPPPTFTASSEQVDTGTTLYLDAGNSASYSGTGTTWRDMSSRGLTADMQPTSLPTTSSGPTSCAAPTFSRSNKGIFTFSKAAKTCGYVANNGYMNTSYTYQVWLKRDGAQTDWSSVIATPWNGVSTQISLTLHWAVSGSDMYLETGMWAETYGWKLARSATPIANNTWVLATVTFNGSNELTLSVDTLNKVSAAVNIPLSTAAIIPGLLIGKRFDQNTDYFNGSIGSIRIYNRVLTDDEIWQNYNSTYQRYVSANANDIAPSQKYGLTTQESFTVTSGSGAKNITFAVGNLSGITWDTATSNVVNLNISNIASVGTYLDTITATDTQGSVTQLPITITISKADTVTISTGPATTTVYTGLPALNKPTSVISGLAGVDTATIETHYYTATCAQGGLCNIGDVGPGGGRVFYIADRIIDSATGVSAGGIYLEVAPLNWNNTGSNEQATAFASSTTAVSGTLDDIGSGANNTLLWQTALTSGATAANLAANRTLNGKSDWFVPSWSELEKAIKVLRPLGLGEFTNPANLWSSTQAPDATQVKNAWSGANADLNLLTKTTGFYLRPIRAFSPTVFETSTPIDVDTYTARGANLTFQIGNVSNYIAVVYETSTLKITQAKQQPLLVNYYGARAGSTFTLQVSGGSGTGAYSETITAGSTASNCALSNHILSNSNSATDQKYCSVLLTRAASRNYLVETMTANIYFMVMENNMPTNQVGSGPTIGLNGQTSVTTEDTATVQVPVITGFFDLSNNPITSFDVGVLGQFVIKGRGFGSGQVLVKFWRNKTILVTPSGGTAIYITNAAVPIGATSGPISITLANTAYANSPSSLTIIGTPSGTPGGW